MKPALSLVSTPSLPSFWVYASPTPIVSSDVVTQRTTSTSFMTWAGLKKCRPRKRSGRDVAAAIWMIGSDEVFEAKYASASTLASSFFHTSSFSPAFSVIASMTRPASARSASSSVAWMRPRTASASSWVERPFSTARASCFSILPMPLARMSSVLSMTTTSYPAAADTWAMPWPIRPQPTTPIFVISGMERQTTAHEPRHDRRPRPGPPRRPQPAREAQRDARRARAGDRRRAQGRGQRPGGPLRRPARRGRDVLVGHGLRRAGRAGRHARAPARLPARVHRRVEPRRGDDQAGGLPDPRRLHRRRDGARARRATCA